MELEAVKTMTWHKKPLVEAFDELGYKYAYSEVNPSYFQPLGKSSYQEAFNEMGEECYKKLGMPNDKKILERQRKKFGWNKLTEVDANPW